MARILLVEDDEAGRHLLVEMLRKLGHEVAEAPDGREALREMGEPAAGGEPPFAAVLMDLQMPVMDGLDATAALRRAGWTEVPIIAVTAHAMVGDREKCLGAGMNDYLAKPLTMDMLRGMLERWLPVD